MIDRDEFLKSYNIEQEDFEAADMPWEELAAIYEDYHAMEGKLRNIGKDFVDRTIMLNYNFHCVKPPKHTNKCLM